MHAPRKRKKYDSSMSLEDSVLSCCISSLALHEKITVYSIEKKILEMFSSMDFIAKPNCVEEKTQQKWSNSSEKSWVSMTSRHNSNTMLPWKLNNVDIFLNHQNLTFTFKLCSWMIMKMVHHLYIRSENNQHCLYFPLLQNKWKNNFLSSTFGIR